MLCDGSHLCRYAQDSAGARNVAAFLTDLADSDPAAVLRSSGVAVLLSHLDGENYAMRNAIISMLTAIVCHIVATDGQVRRRNYVLLCSFRSRRTLMHSR